MKMYGVLKNARFDGAKVLVLSQDVEKDAVNAKMSISEYVRATKEINPQIKIIEVAEEIAESRAEFKFTKSLYDIPQRKMCTYEQYLENCRSLGDFIPDLEEWR